MPTLRQIGYGIMAVAIVIFLVGAYWTDKTVQLNLQLHGGCELPEELCPYTTSIPIEGATILVGSGLMFGAGYYTLRQKPAIQSKTLHMNGAGKARKIAAALQGDERKVYNIVLNSDGFIFQNELIEKGGLNKVSMTRILDKLEGKGLIERRRRGMSNVVVLKH